MSKNTKQLEVSTQLKDTSLASERKTLSELELVTDCLIKNTEIVKELAQELVTLTLDIETRTEQLRQVLRISEKQLEREEGILHLECINRMAEDLHNAKLINKSKSLLLKLLGMYLTISFPMKFMFPFVTELQLKRQGIHLMR